MDDREAIECAMDLAELAYWREFHRMDGLFPFHVGNVTKVRTAAREKVQEKIDERNPLNGGR